MLQIQILGFTLKLHLQAMAEENFCSKLWRSKYLSFVIITTFGSWIDLSGQASTHIGFREGLGTYAVTDITPDRDGCMWIATYSGIYKHEGTRIRPIIENTSNNIPIAKLEVHSIFEDQDGYIWAGSLNGVYKINKYTLQATHYPVKPKDPKLVSVGGIYAVFEGSKNEIWISCDEGMYILDKTSGQMRRVSTGKDKYSIPNHVASYKTGVKYKNGVWFYTKEGMAYYNTEKKYFEHKYHNPQNLNIFELPSSYGNGAASYTIKGQNDEIWFISNQKWLTRYHVDSDRIDTFRINLPKETWACCQSIALDTVNQKVWIGTRHGGLYSFDIPSQKFTHYAREKSGNIISSNYINALTLDKNNQLWVGSDNGINILDSDKHAHQLTLVSSRSDFINLKYQLGTLSIYRGRKLIIPFLNGKIFEKDIIDESEIVEITPENEINDSYYVHVAGNNKYHTHSIIEEDIQNPDKGFIHGVAVKSLNQRLKDIPGLIIWIYSPREGQLYVKKNRGHLIYIDTEGCFEIMSCLGFKRNVTANQDKNEIWYLGNNYELIKKSNETLREDSIILAMHLIDRDWSFTNPRDILYNDQSIWITSQNGLLRYFIKEDSITTYTVNDGLVTSFTFTLIEDKADDLWVGSLGGINKFDKKNKRFTSVVDWSVSTYMDSFGSSIMDSLGNLHFVIGNRYIKILPQNYGAKKVKKYDILFNKLAINGLNYDLSLPHTFSTLSYDQNMIEINFGLLNFSSKSNLRLLYRLNDDNSEWLASFADGIVNFNELQPGSYTFQVKAQNILGEDISDLKSLRFTIRPHFSQTHWFRVIIIILVGALIYAFFRYRVQQIKKEESIRTKIASDLHDDVASTVGSISYYSEYGKSLQDPNDLTTIGILDKIGETAREAMESMRDVIWATHAKFDNYLALKQKLYSFGEDLANSKNMKFEWIDNNVPQNLTLSPLVRRNVYMVIKEAINNAIKYSGASSLVINVAPLEGGYAFSVTDNGKGFDIQKIKRGNGLDNMNMRAAQMNAKLQVFSEEGGGTKILVYVPRMK